MPEWLFISTKRKKLQQAPLIQKKYQIQQLVLQQLTEQDNKNTEIMNPQGSVLDVLSGKESLKFEIAMDVKTIALLTAGIFIAVLGGVIIARNLTNS